MVKSSKPSSLSWLASSTELTTLYSNAICERKHNDRRPGERALLEFSEDPRPIDGPDDGALSHGQKDPMLEDTGNGVQHRCQIAIDGGEARVQNQVVVIGGKGLVTGHPKLRPAAKRLDRTAGDLPEERQHLDRHRILAEALDELALIGNED